jgi:hypothetical protein
MCSCLGRKILVVGTALTTGGILTGIAAIYFHAIPRLPLVASIGVTIPFCLAIVGTMVGFAWLCEKFDDLRVTSAEDFVDRSKKAGVVEVQPLAEGGSAYRARRGFGSGRRRPLPAGSRSAPTGLLSHRTGWTAVGTVTVTANGWHGQ